MIKILIIIFVTIILFTSATYLGVLSWLTTNIQTFNSDFLPYIPIEIRLTFWLIILGLWFAVAKSFTK